MRDRSARLQNGADLPSLNGACSRALGIASDVGGGPIWPGHGPSSVAFSAGSFSRYAGENTYSSAFTARLPTAYMPASGPEVNSQRKRSAVRPSVAGTCQVLTAAPAPSSSQLVGSGRRTVKRTAAGSAAQYLAWSVAVPASRVAVQ